MSEHSPTHETQKQHETVHDHEHSAKLEKQIVQKAEMAQSAGASEDLSRIAKRAETHAEASENIKVNEHVNNEPDATLGMQQTLKSEAYQHTLKSIRAKLPKTSKAFSKFAHHKVVDVLSEAGAKTVARPSGLLGGSLVSFAGSLILLYYSRHYGFTYNYALLFMLFIAGFLAGVVLEIIIWTLYSRRRQHR